VQPGDSPRLVQAASRRLFGDDNDGLASSRYTRPLTELVSLAFGPRFVIGEEFDSLDGTAVAIYGSWAARYQGIAGHAPHDVDVLVIGEVPRRDMYEAAERAEQRLGLPVNPVLCSLPRWFAAADALIQQLRTTPLVWVIGEEPQQKVDNDFTACDVKMLLPCSAGRRGCMTCSPWFSSPTH
jgi:hypothetical protein